MKNLFYLSVLVLAAGLSACASDVNEGNGYQYNGREGCSDTLIKERPAPVVQPAPIAQSCGCPVTMPSCGCPAQEYTVRTPVKVIYQNTTYRTVYEPRTFATTSYEERPYTGCPTGNCTVAQQPVMGYQRPAMAYQMR